MFVVMSLRQMKGWYSPREYHELERDLDVDFREVGGRKWRNEGYLQEIIV